MGLGKRIKQARLALGLSQEELARLVGVTKGAIGNYEVDLSSPNEKTLIALMKHLKVDANFLYQDDVDFSVLDEPEMFRIFNSLTPNGQDKLLDLARMFLDAERRDK